MKATSAGGIKIVWIILMENHNWSQIKGSNCAPYINNSLLPMASHAEQYFNPPWHSSQLAKLPVAGSWDKFWHSRRQFPCVNSQSTTQHLVSFLQQKGITWKTYQEDVSGTDCPLVSSGEYAVKHNPFVYFDDVTSNQNPNSANCIAHVRPFTELAHDLATNNVAQYNFITPNLCNDMHDSCQPLQDPIKQGDTWLANNLPMILTSSAYQNGGAVFITWDEAATGDGPIGMIVLSPLAKGNGYENSIYYNHGSTLRTLQEIFNVTPLLNDAAKQTDLSDLFSVFP